MAGLRRKKSYIFCFEASGIGKTSAIKTQRVWVFMQKFIPSQRSLMTSRKKSPMM